MIEREDGTLCLETRGDPATERVLGYRRHYLGVDLGMTDPSAFAICTDQRVPYWDGTRQKLHDRQRVIVWADYLQDTAYSAIAAYIQQIMAQPAVKGRIRLAFDATGLGKPFGSMLSERQIPYTAVTITAGQAVTRKGNEHHVAKNVLLGNLANGLETKALTVAHDLPLLSRLQDEFASFETKTTGAGNIVLDARAKDHHGDIAIAVAIAYHLSSNAPQAIGVGTLAGLY